MIGRAPGTENVLTSRQVMDRIAAGFQSDSAPRPEPASQEACIRGICMLTADIDSSTGGVQKQSIRLLKELTARGIAASICTRNYHHVPRHEVREGIRILRSPVLKRSLRVANSAAYLADAAAWLLRHRSEYDVIHCQQLSGPAMAGLLARPMVRKPVVVRVTLSGEAGEVAELGQMPLSSFRIRQLRKVDHWVALSHEMAAEIETIGVDRDRITVIPNAALIPADSAANPETRLRFRRGLGLDFDRLVIYSGRLSSEKNLDVLLRAWAEVRRSVPDAHLLLAGAGGAFRNVERDLHNLVKDLQLGSSVHFLGHVSNLGEYLLAADLFVLPTSREGMSNSLVESLAAGNAIVTTGIEANREVVRDGETALMVPPREVEALARAIVRVLGSKELGCRLGARAREQAERRHSIPAMTEAYLEVYRRAVLRAQACFSAETNP